MLSLSMPFWSAPKGLLTPLDAPQPTIVSLRLQPTFWCLLCHRDASQRTELRADVIGDDTSVGSEHPRDAHTVVTVCCFKLDAIAPSLPIA